MSTGSEIAGLALQDILDGIADGLNEAQQSLRNMAPYDEFGRPNTIYQLPYLDFSLQVTSEFDSYLNKDNQEKKVMRFAPAKESLVTTSARTELFSTISGRFVATTPNEGLPQTILEIQTKEPQKRYSKYEVEVRVDVRNAALEKLVGSKVEFNFDEDLTNTLNGVDSVPLIVDGELYSDQDGMVSTLFKIPAEDYDKGRIFVFNVNVGNVHKTVSIGK